MSDMTLADICREFLKACSVAPAGDCAECTDAFKDAILKQLLRPGGLGPDQPDRFLAMTEHGVPFASGGEPQVVQNMAQDYAEAHKGEYVHLYQHAMSLRCADGD